MDFFDARSVTPQQGFDTHPPGMYDFQITHTYLKPTKSNDGMMLVVELTSPVGKVDNRYNLMNKEPKAVEIAQKELSALCHAVNIFRITFPKGQDGNPIMDQAARELRGGRGRMEIVPQTDREGKPTGYVEVKKVYDVNGNEPGKQGSAPQPQQQQWGNQQQPPQGQQQPQQQPMQQQPNGGWTQPQQQPQQPAPQNGPAWGANQQQPPQGQPQGQQQPQWGNQPQGNPPANPPWGSQQR